MVMEMELEFSGLEGKYKLSSCLDRGGDVKRKIKMASTLEQMGDMGQTGGEQFKVNREIKVLFNFGHINFQVFLRYPIRDVQ